MSVLRRHPDLLPLLLIVVVALGMRLGFAPRAPVFLVRDSIAYYQSGHAFATTGHFEVPFKRVPIYPLFVAGVIVLGGEEPMVLTFVQHLIGVLTAVLTYFLGRALFGRATGLIAGLLVALSGPLIIYEHYVMAEPLFILLLLLFGLALVQAVRSGRSTMLWMALAGLLLGLASLTRPVGQAALLALPLALLVALKPWQRAALAYLAIFAGFALVMLPWMGRNYVKNGSFESAGALGQTLAGRIVWHDEGFAIPSPDSPSPYSDPQRAAARAFILRQYGDDRPSVIHQKLLTSFGLSEAQASRAMRDVGLEIILAQKEHYLHGTLLNVGRLLSDGPPDFGYHWNNLKHNNLRDQWKSYAPAEHLLPAATAWQETQRETAKSITTFFWPFYLRWPLLALLLVGVVAGWRTPSRWAVVFVILLTFAIVIPAAALVGDVPRYRYPADPFLAVLIGYGAVSVMRAASRFVERVSPRRPVRQVEVGAGAASGRSTSQF